MSSSATRTAATKRVSKSVQEEGLARARVGQSAGDKAAARAAEAVVAARILGQTDAWRELLCEQRGAGMERMAEPGKHRRERQPGAWNRSCER